MTWCARVTPGEDKIGMGTQEQDGQNAWPYSRRGIGLDRRLAMADTR
jgi:hypothetical protein